MSQIYWDLHEIPRPENSYINHSDGRVFIISDIGNGKKKRTVIGRATSETMMHANDMFRYLFPSQWEKAYGQMQAREHVLSAGMYAVSLSIGYKSGLYPILHKAYGPLHANMIMDYANYSILERSDVSFHYANRMRHEVLYSKEAYSDSWISDFFKAGMNEDQNHLFRMLWLEECKKRGVTKAWISIDGSNSDCQIKASDLSQKGKAKSDRNITVVSYIYAVSAEDGLPLTYFVSDGSVTDGRAFQKVVELLNGAGIEVEGIILDRGFCSHEIVSKLKSLGYDYILMLESNTTGHVSMMKKHAADIRWNILHCAGEDGLFGIQEETRLFASHEETAFVSLFFDGINGSERAVTLIKKVRKAMRDVESQRNAGKSPNVPADLKNILSVVTDGTTSRLEIDYVQWQRLIDAKGYSSIASSKEMAPEEVNRIYHLRDVSEKQFAILKTQLGYDVLRVHGTEGIENKFAVCFVASIIRSLFSAACKRLQLETTRMIREMDRICLMLMPDNSYIAIDNLTDRQKKLLSEFELDYSDFQFFATDVNSRMDNAVTSQIRVLQDKEIVPKRRRGRPPKPKEEPAEDMPKRGPGRPPGSKNKKTILREAEQGIQKESQGGKKRSPGRPPGSKNKKTLLREAGLAEETMPKVKRGRGRPKGSKNKPK